MTAATAVDTKRKLVAVLSAAGSIPPSFVRKDRKTVRKIAPMIRKIYVVISQTSYATGNFTVMAGRTPTYVSVTVTEPMEPGANTTDARSAKSADERNHQKA